MKKAFISLFAIAGITLAFMAFTFPVNNSFKDSGNPPQDKVMADFPEDVAKVMETSCYDCHSDAASNVKAKTKLNFSKWGEMSAAKKVGKMEGINDVIKSGDMPPGKYLEKYPERALNDDQKKLVESWVAEESKKLLGE